MYSFFFNQLLFHFSKLLKWNIHNMLAKYAYQHSYRHDWDPHVVSKISVKKVHCVKITILVPLNLLKWVCCLYTSARGATFRGHMEECFSLVLKGTFVILPMCGPRGLFKEYSLDFNRTSTGLAWWAFPHFPWWAHMGLRGPDWVFSGGQMTYSCRNNGVFLT